MGRTQSSVPQGIRRIILNSKQLAALEHLGYVVALGVVGTAATWAAGPGPGNLFGSQVAIFVIPSLMAVLAGAKKYLASQADDGE